MLQIRIWGCRGYHEELCSRSTDRKSFAEDVNINVPTTPEVGLYLEECFFISYNKKRKDSHEELSMKAYEQEPEEFKNRFTAYV
ncbi:hypothetical protein CJ030_MR5G021860 [Morella rubra]|uniref:Uncharacterized protein n=1 Tax=Morella rubra TaxID=262757 RepID=A0A6A1VQ10_9ROSI|nr:hypothetical protein CJ030_MR5G021860 [Morella rubra]